MESLSWIFFCLTPFGFFCTENGTGLITGTVFLILGFVFKWLGKNGGETPTAKVKVEPQKFWEWHYMDSINNGGIDQNARTWATTVARAHSCPIPSDAEQERIARKNGIITEQMKYDEQDKWNRIQVAKYRLMNDLYEKYKAKGRITSSDYVSGRTGRQCCPYFYIESSMSALKGFIKVNRWNKDPWNSVISESEKAEAKKWITEYEERLIREVNDYIENGTLMPTIRYHRETGGWSVYTDYNIKYGFTRE